MQRIFLSPQQFQGETALISGSDHLHLARVMRARVGESVLLLDGQGGAFRATVETIGKSETTARIAEAVVMLPEPPVFLTVAQSLSKGDKFEQVIQHGTEAGASAFVPVRAERSVADIPAAKVAERLARWRQIAKGAAEQSGRSIIPIISEPVTLRQCFAQAEKESMSAVLLHPADDSRALRSLLTGEKFPARFLLAIGPEGGWSAGEVLAAQMANIPCAGLGPRILRTETAALIAISQILYAAGE